jgi:chromosome segregation ATPase
MKVEINKIKLDGGTQFRKTLHQNKIYEYKEAMEEGANFPKIKAKFDGVNYWLYSGFHRYHAMKLLNLKEIEIIAESGAKSDAVLAALAENSDHGIPLTNEEKRMKVEAALNLDDYVDASDYEIAKLCRVSRTFVAAVRKPEVKETQKKNREKSATKKATSSPTTSTKSDNLSENDISPSKEELEAEQMREDADRLWLIKLMESDDKIAAAQKEIEKLNDLHSKARARINGLTNELNEAVKRVKYLQNKLNKLEKEKK